MGIVNFAFTISFIVFSCVQSIVSNQLLKKNLKEAIDSSRIHHQLMPMEVAYEDYIDKVNHFYEYIFVLSGLHFIFPISRISRRSWLDYL